jgi:xanthine dehydrogenase YagT iron-sulfur-binding subunit
MQVNRPGGSTGTGFSRRGFLKGSGAAAAAAAIIAPPEQARAQDGNTAKLVDGWVEITLSVNGKDHTVQVEPRTTLLEVLRDKLNLTGCKDLQDVSVDGADTVHVDGKATYAGTMLALAARGKQSTPGFVMATRAFLDKQPGATLEQVREGLGGNICRCGTYDGITKCALELAKQ